MMHGTEELFVTGSRGMSDLMSGILNDFELYDGKRSDKFLCFTLLRNFRRAVRISATRCLIDMGFGSKCSILMDK